MAKTKQRYKLESFDPRFHELLLRGARETFELREPNRAKAYSFQTRAQNYRAQFKREKPTEEKTIVQLYRCKITILDDVINHTYVITFGPHDEEFDSLLDAAGIAQPSDEVLEHDPLDDVDIPDEGPLSSPAQGPLFQIKLPK